MGGRRRRQALHSAPGWYRHSESNLDLQSVLTVFTRLPDRVWTCSIKSSAVLAPFKGNATQTCQIMVGCCRSSTIKISSPKTSNNFQNKFAPTFLLQELVLILEMPRCSGQVYVQPRWHKTEPEYAWESSPCRLGSLSRNDCANLHLPDA